MRVVSFNVRYDNPMDAHTWREREGLCVRLIEELAPDVLGLQETLQHQVEGVRRALAGYDVVWAGRDDGGAHGESCPMFFRSALFRAVDSGHFWLSSTPAVPGSRSWGTACPRMCTFVVLETRANLRVLVMNTHMDHVSAEASKDPAWPCFACLTFCFRGARRGTGGGTCSGAGVEVSVRRGYSVGRL
jgi:endonuclease/exonuclease/phosphatase family metal-dependent hydrolase